MITRILLLALAASVAVAQAEETPKGEKPRRERLGKGEGAEKLERAGLTKEEADKAKQALEAAKDNPAVAQARDAAKQAVEAVKAAKEAGKSREEIEPLAKAAREAMKAAREAHVAAAVATDPSLQPIFDKLRAARKEAGEGRGPKGPRPERKKKDAGEAPAGA